MGAALARDGRPSVLNVALRFFALLITVVAVPLVLLSVADTLLRDHHTQTRVECTTCDPLTTLTAPTTPTTPTTAVPGETVPGETLPGQTVPGETVPAGGAQAVAPTTTTTIPPTPVATFTGRPVKRDGDDIQFRVASISEGDWSDVERVAATGIDLAPWRQYEVEVVVPVGETAPAIWDMETKGFVFPAGWAAFGVLPTYDLLALIAAPLLLVSVAFLFVDNRRRGRSEAAHGVPITLVLRRRKRRRRPARPASRRLSGDAASP